MKLPNLSKDVVPIGEFKSQAARWLEQLRKTGNPIVITQNGKPAGVVVSPGEFDRIRERQKFVDSVNRGIEDAEANRVMDTKELKKRLAKARNNR